VVTGRARLFFGCSDSLLGSGGTEGALAVLVRVCFAGVEGSSRAGTINDALTVFERIRLAGIVSSFAVGAAVLGSEEASAVTVMLAASSDPENPVPTAPSLAFALKGWKNYKI